MTSAWGRFSILSPSISRGLELIDHLTALSRVPKELQFVDFADFLCADQRSGRHPGRPDRLERSALQDPSGRNQTTGRFPSDTGEGRCLAKHSQWL